MSNESKYTVTMTLSIEVNALSKEEAILIVGRQVSKIDSDKNLLKYGIDMAIIDKYASKQI